MNGILIKPHYASSIIRGTKDIEYRNYELPKNYVDTPIYLLSKGCVFGIITLTPSCHDEGEFEYFIEVKESWLDKPKYNHPNGAVLYVKNVKLIDQTKGE